MNEVNASSSCMRPDGSSPAGCVAVTTVSVSQPLLQRCALGREEWAPPWVQFLEDGGTSGCDTVVGQVLKLLPFLVHHKVDRGVCICALAVRG